MACTAEGFVYEISGASVATVSEVGTIAAVAGVGALAATGDEGASYYERVYRPSPKHDPKHGWGSPNPIPDEKTGQKLLDSAYSSSKNKQLYNIYNNKLIKFQPDTVNGGWHAYEVVNPVKEVPVDVLRRMLRDGIITKPQYTGFLKNQLIK